MAFGGSAFAAGQFAGSSGSGEVIMACYGSVVGATSASTVCGDDVAAVVAGASAARGSVSGGDARREGC